MYYSDNNRYKTQKNRKILLTFHKKSCKILLFCYGVWLSLVEHYVRDVEVAGSNPVTPIFFKDIDKNQCLFYCVCQIHFPFSFMFSLFFIIFIYIYTKYYTILLYILFVFSYIQHFGKFLLIIWHGETKCGILSHTTITIYCTPNVTREQAAVIMTCFLKHANVSLENSTSNF